jgi:hypothetical protein
LSLAIDHLGRYKRPKCMVPIHSMLTATKNLACAEFAKFTPKIRSELQVQTSQITATRGVTGLFIQYHIIVRMLLKAKEILRTEAFS